MTGTRFEELLFSFFFCFFCCIFYLQFFFFASIPSAYCRQAVVCAELQFLYQLERSWAASALRKNLLRIEKALVTNNFSIFSECGTSAPLTLRYPCPLMPGTKRCLCRRHCIQKLIPINKKCEHLNTVNRSWVAFFH